MVSFISIIFLENFSVSLFLLFQTGLSFAQPVEFLVRLILLREKI